MDEEDKKKELIEEEKRKELIEYIQTKMNILSNARAEFFSVLAVTVSLIALYRWICKVF